MTALIGCRQEEVREIFPDLSKADITSDVRFSNVISAQEVREDLWLISDFAERKVFAFWPSSDSVFPLGQVGPGPGEYLRPAFLWRLAGDTVLMVNQFQLRWDVFVDGFVGPRLAGSIPPIGPANQSLISFDTLGGLLRVRNGPVASDSQFVELVDRSNGTVRTVARLEPPFPGYSSTPPPYPAQWGSAGISPDGWVAILRPDPYRIDWIRPDGSVILGDSIPVEAVPVNAEEKSFYLSHLSAERAAERLKSSDWPDLVPAVTNSQLHFSPRGELVVERVRSTILPGRVYDVIDRSGKNVRKIRLPRESRIAAIGQKAALILTEDGDGFLRPSLLDW